MNSAILPKDMVTQNTCSGHPLCYTALNHPFWNTHVSQYQSPPTPHPENLCPWGAVCSFEQWAEHRQ